MPPVLFSPLLEHAIELSAIWHDRTYRRMRWRPPAYEPPPEEVLRIPVMAHVTAVGLTLQRAGWDDATVAAGFLHDVIEDPNQHSGRMVHERLADLVGTEVANLVRAVSEPKHGDRGEPLPWRTRKEVYLETLARGPAAAMAISLADKLHNLWTLNQAMEGGMDVFASHGGQRGLSSGPEAQLWYFNSVLELAATFRDVRLADLHECVAEELARFERLAHR
jgi:hypothetical protein